MGPRVFQTIPALRVALVEARQAGARIGFAPTMGALHEGHASLMTRARAECGLVVVSIFVNPTQFDKPDDLARYPRTPERDLAVCASRDVDIVFAPAVEEMYPRPLECAVEVGATAAHLCGRARPGHFRGVATVVMKLLQIVQPDAAYFGEKDAQQLAVVRRMVRDFDVPVAVIGVPTVREADGLAMSSRNQRLGPDERRLAPALYQALQRAEAMVADGITDAARITRTALATLPRDERLKAEYLDLVDPDTFQPVVAVSGPVIAAGAIRVGSTRLIDNVRCVPG